VELEIENRELVIEQTRKEDERSDLKQHADKMLRDFEKFNDHSSNRAIWELVQNACDLTIDCEIEIDYREKKISFSHNGKAFNTKSLISLIKQVSGKYGIQEEEDIPEVGKYGTGFLTTHSFGRKFIIDSVLHTGSYYIPITNFEIDRSPKTWELLSDNISDQKKIVYDILKNEKSIDCTDISTTFTYLPQTPKEFEYIEKSLSNLDNYIPLVFTVNERLKKVKIIDIENTTIEYNFKEKNKVENDQEINLYQTIISKNGSEIHLYSIIDLEDEIEIILPINKEKEVFEFDEQIARLFLYYPLIGSENFGINFIINCKKFLPTEPRDGIHLKSDKDQVKDQEVKNREIINKCTEIIFAFLNSNVLNVSNPLLYTNVNFKTNSDNPLLNEFYDKLQIDWNEKLELLPFVKTIEGYKTIKEVDYFSEEFLNSDEATFDSFYELISKFYSIIPLKEEVVLWSKNAVNWKSDSINFITHSDLLDKISECNLDDFNKVTLKKYYQHLIDIDHSSFFNDYKLLPNINGDFNMLSHFLVAEDLNESLLNIGAILIPESLSKLIQPEFKFSFSLNSFNRRDFSDDVKNSLDKEELNESIFFSDCLDNESYHSDLVKSKEKVNEHYFKAILDFCMLVNNIEINNKPIQLVKIIAQYYGFSDSLILLPTIKEDNEKIEYRSIRKVLVKIFLNTLSLHNNSWVENNLELLNQICSLNDDSYKDIFKESKIYPNQIFELHLSENLKRDLGVKKDIKDFYLKVKKEDIEEVLSLVNFNYLIPEDNTINNRYLTTIIEDIIFKDDISNIDEHQHKDVILKIIPKLTEKEYQQFFPQLNDKKANIMISVLSKAETKDDIFAIVTLADEKLKSIGKLINNPDFEAILNQAMSNLEDEKQTKANFQFKHQIGTHIEEILKEHLKHIFNPEDIKYDVKGEQDGQDIIIKIKEEPKYYIEVKSRWDKRTSIKMSKNQTIRSNEKKEIYSLCSVDMTDYADDDRFEISDISKILDNIIFVNDIGVHVEHLIEVLKQTNKEEEIHLDGDYRTLVPQSIVNEYGISISAFETYLIDLLKN
jgi:predicted  nucleic acid-binding Zn-ribbon protein